jgi:predicted RNA-binding protein with EMAP domain
MDKNATRASLVAGHIGAVREKTALDNLTTDDLAEAGRAALSVVTGPFRRVKQDYEEQKRRAGR